MDIWSEDLHDHHGAFLTAFMENLVSTSSKAELLAFKGGLKFAYDLGICKLEIQLSTAHLSDP